MLSSFSLNVYWLIFKGKLTLHRQINLIPMGSNVYRIRLARKFRLPSADACIEILIFDHLPGSGNQISRCRYKHLTTFGVDELNF